MGAKAAWLESDPHVPLKPLYIHHLPLLQEDDHNSLGPMGLSSTSCVVAHWKYRCVHHMEPAGGIPRKDQTEAPLAGVFALFRQAHQRCGVISTMMKT